MFSTVDIPGLIGRIISIKNLENSVDILLIPTKNVVGLMLLRGLIPTPAISAVKLTNNFSSLILSLFSGGSKYLKLISLASILISYFIVLVSKLPKSTLSQGKCIAPLLGAVLFDIDAKNKLSSNFSPPMYNVDLGSFDTSTIKYDMRMLASDINFKYLLPPENRDKINDEKLLVNLTADIAGVGISPLNNIRPTTFFVGISKMSTEFSKFLIEMIRPINPGISTVENIVQFGYDPNSVEFSISANKVFTTFYFRDQNLDKPNQQKQQLIAFEGDKFGLEPMPFSDVISYLEGGN